MKKKYNQYVLRRSEKKSYSTILSVKHFIRAGVFWLLLKKRFFSTPALFFLFLMASSSLLFSSNLDAFEKQIQQQIQNKDFHYARTLCEALPQNAQYRLSLQFLCGKAFLFLQEENLAQMKENQQNANRYFSRVIEALQPLALQKKQASTMLLQSYFFRGLNFSYARQCNAAVSNFKKVLQFAPKHKATLFNITVCLAEKSEATIYLKRLNQIDKNFIANHL